VNASKTKVLHVGAAEAPTLSLPDGRIIETCSDFSYLGCHVASPQLIVRERNCLAWQAAQQLRPIFHSHASDRTKIRLFRAAVEPILTYGLEAVPLTSWQLTIDASHRSLLRFALGIRHPVHVTSAELMLRADFPPISVTLRQRKLTLLRFLSSSTFPRSCARCALTCSCCTSVIYIYI
jgi:hypothetical protein